MGLGSSQPPNVAVALADAVESRAARERELLQELAALGAERERLRVALAQIDAQRAALDPIELDVRARLSSLADGAYTVLFDSLNEQRDALASRAALVSQVERAHAESARVDIDNIDALLVEYRQFRDVIAPTLGDLPVSYRSVLQVHHDGVVARLRGYYSRIGTQPVAFDGPPLELDVVVAVDGDGQEADTLTLALPVRGDVVAVTLDGAPDLELVLAARVAQALHEALEALQQPLATVAFGEHRGMLVIEAELEPIDRALAVDQMLAVLEDVLGTSPEVVAAQLVVRATEVPADHLFPLDGQGETAEEPRE